jgi:hypothetical protein
MSDLSNFSNAALWEELVRRGEAWIQEAEVFWEPDCLAVKVSRGTGTHTATRHIQYLWRNILPKELDPTP